MDLLWGTAMPLLDAYPQRRRGVVFAAGAALVATPGTHCAPRHKP